MPVNKVFFISFHAESEKGILINSHYLKNNDALIPRTIQLFDDRPRKMLGGKKAGLCRIDFAFNEFNEPFDLPILNIDAQKTNHQIGKERLKLFLMQVTDHSTIYINMHGDRKNNRLVQKVAWRENGEIKYKVIAISVKYLASLFGKYIPQHAKEGLNIYLMVCRSVPMAKELMHELHLNNFTKTVVVGYWGKVTIGYMPTLDGMGDYFSEGHARIEDGEKFHCPKSEYERRPSDKVCFHNYSGVVREESYESVKNKWILPECENQNKKIIYDDRYHDSLRQYQLILFITKILKAVHNYIEHNQKNQSPLLATYSEAELKIAFYFSDRVILYSNKLFSKQNTYIVKQGSRDYFTYANLARIETLICQEIVNLIKRADEYQRFPRTDNVLKHSNLSFILRALDEFFREMQQEKLSSEVFQEFLMALTGGHGFGMPPNSSKHYLFDRWEDCEEGREVIKNKIARFKGWTITA